MSELIVAVFADQFSAYEGVRSLEELHDAGNATDVEAIDLAIRARGRIVRAGRRALPIGAAAVSLAQGNLG